MRSDNGALAVAMAFGADRCAQRSKALIAFPGVERQRNLALPVRIAFVRGRRQHLLQLSEDDFELSWGSEIRRRPPVTRIVAKRFDVRRGAGRGPISAVGDQRVVGLQLAKAHAASVVAREDKPGEGVAFVWAASGRYFDYSDGWQLVINTGTTIVTFLMAFLIQATQYRESKAINLKIDELMCAHDGARTGFINLDNMTDEELDDLTTELQRLGRTQKIGPVRDMTSFVDGKQSGKPCQKQRCRHTATAKP